MKVEYDSYIDHLRKSLRGNCKSDCLYFVYRSFFYFENFVVISFTTTKKLLKYDKCFSFSFCLFFFLETRFVRCAYAKNLMFFFLTFF